MRPPQVLVGAVVVGLLLTPAASANAAEINPTRAQVYADAAATFGVPLDVLLGVSYLESRWDTNAGTPSTSGGFGPMHLTDAAFLASQPDAPHEEDRRGDETRPLPIGHATPPGPSPAALQTLDQAAELTGVAEDTLRTDPIANIRGGAALLRAYQEGLDGPLGAGSDAGAWYGAVARYSGADSADAAAAFADEVYTTIRGGAARTTDDGHSVALAAHPVTPQRS